MEYEVYLLDPTRRLCHMGKVLYDSDDLSMALTFCHKYFTLHNVDVCVWQPKKGYYREYYYRKDPATL